MRTSSSTSSSERTAAAAFALVLAALTVSYELLVRTAEARYGTRPAGVVSPRLPKIEALAADLGGGAHYSVYALGSSRTEEGLRSDALTPPLGTAFNLGMSGSSLLSGFEALDLLGERPALVIAGVSPMDFSALFVRQGSGHLRRARDSVALLRAPRMQPSAASPATVARDLTYAMLHGAEPNRRRNLGQWLDRIRLRGDLLKFLNNADAVAHDDNLWVLGWLGVPRVATPETFRQLRPAATIDEYRAEHEPYYAHLEQAVARRRARGSEVVFVRMPIAPVPRQIEDAAGFDADMRAFAERCGVRYIDGNALAGDAFLHDRRNFVDGGHLNVTGATAFSRALAAALHASAPIRGRGGNGVAMTAR
jgi:hypothetical protein